MVDCRLVVVHVHKRMTISVSIWVSFVESGLYMISRLDMVGPAVVNGSVVYYITAWCSKRSGRLLRRCLL